MRTRYAARAVVIDRDGRTLLFRATMPGHPLRVFWITPGGGLKPGEDEPACVMREVFEETGLSEFELGPCVWRRDHTFRWGDGWLRQVEAYYVIQADAFEVNRDNHEEAERHFLGAHRWFSLEELRAHDEPLVPSRLADLLEPLLSGRYPDAPIEVGP